MANRLRFIREKVLRITQESFAEKVAERSPEPDRWYLQRVARIESGKTKLNEEMVDDIIRAFPELSPNMLFNQGDDPQDGEFSQAHAVMLTGLKEEEARAFEDVASSLRNAKSDMEREVILRMIGAIGSKGDVKR